MRVASLVMAGVFACGVQSAHAEWSWWNLHVGPTISVGPASGRIEGSGKLVDDIRPLAAFKAVHVTGPIDVVLKAGTGERAIVRCDDNLVAMIETQVRAGALEIGPVKQAAFRTGHPLVVTVEFKALDSITIRGSGDVHADRITSDAFDATLAGSGDLSIDALKAGILAVSLSGSGDFRAAGSAATQGFNIAGSGDVIADELAGAKVAVNLAGSGDAKVRASETLDVSIAGSGDVLYRGSPRLTKSVVGSGEVRSAR